jgi:hypothetical protein
MDSSFNFLLGLVVLIFAASYFIFQLFHFGVSRSSVTFIRITTSLSMLAVLGMETFMMNHVLYQMNFMKWLPFIYVVFGVGLLVETIFILGTFQVIQLKIFSRIPILASLVTYATFPNQAKVIALLSVLVGFLLFGIFLKKPHYQKMVYVKLTALIVLITIFKSVSFLGVEYILLILSLFFIFYFFLFQKCIGIKELIARDIQ